MKQLKIIFCKGVPSSGKSTWARSEVLKDPLNYVRINNDEIRSMLNGSSFSQEYEKLVSSTRLFLIKKAIESNRHVVVDNVNANSRHWDDVVSICKKANKDIMLFEKLFYIDLDEAIARDAKREGKAKVGEEVVKKFWKLLGGKQFAHSRGRVEVFTKRNSASEQEFKPLIQDESLTRCVIFDNDGSLSLLNGRNPYDATHADLDLPHLHVIECMKLYFNAGYKIFFVSGREEKDRAPTERFYKKHFPEVEYELFMRPIGNSEKDVIIKERIYNEHIKGKYYLAGWYDDRLSVCQWIFSNGLPLFRVNDPCSSF